MRRPLRVRYLRDSIGRIVGHVGADGEAVLFAERGRDHWLRDPEVRAMFEAKDRAWRKAHGFADDEEQATAPATRRRRR